ncbi:hypothetical protein Tco_0770056 [Tanacetum coccineum]|uniref:Uncharacterized protein n=1 Tax=Tanacetum coccineum TaxID=301880 RepID=A0ABQ4ZBE0_9ASTR
MRWRRRGNGGSEKILKVVEVVVVVKVAKGYQELPKVDDVSLVDGVFDGAFGRDGDEDVVIGEGVVVSSSSLVKSLKWEKVEMEMKMLLYSENSRDPGGGPLNKGAPSLLP